MSWLRICLLFFFSISAFAQQSESSPKLEKNLKYVIACKPQNSLEYRLKLSPLFQTIEPFKVRFDQQTEDKNFYRFTETKPYYFDDFKDEIREKVSKWLSNPRNKDEIIYGSIVILGAYATSPSIRDSSLGLKWTSSLTLDRKSKTRFIFSNSINKPKFSLASGHYEFTFAPKADSLNPRSDNGYRYRLMYRLRL